jgi:hypothetical protein
MSAHRFPRIHVLIARALAAAVLIVVAAPAVRAQVTYQVNVNTQLDGVDVKVEYVAQRTLLVLNLSNTGATRARCDVVFDPAPQIPQRNSRAVNPGRTSSVVLRAQRTWFTVNVDVRCSAATR